jgi:fluoride ion exporter CrcB/FEX
MLRYKPRVEVRGHHGRKLIAIYLDGNALAIVAGGGIGSFTTWILDSHRLASSDRTRLAALNIAISIAAGFAALALGHCLGTAL